MSNSPSIHVMCWAMPKAVRSQKKIASLVGLELSNLAVQSHHITTRPGGQQNRRFEPGTSGIYALCSTSLTSSPARWRAGGERVSAIQNHIPMLFHIGDLLGGGWGARLESISGYPLGPHLAKIKGSNTPQCRSKVVPPFQSPNPTKSTAQRGRGMSLEPMCAPS